MLYSVLRGLFATRFHRHTNLSPVSHDHDADYSQVGHAHDTSHDHDADYSPVGHTHDTSHDHDADYSPVGHTHPGAGIPVGVIEMWAGSSDSVPSGWLLCDGMAISRTTYADLFTVIGVAFGAGDGSTTFALPNLIRRFPLGAAFAGDGGDNYNYTLGNVGGEQNHTLSAGEMPVHTHLQDAHNHTINRVLIGASGSATVAPSAPGTGTNNTTTENATATNQNAGSGFGHNNIPPFLSLNFIIRYN